MPHAAGSRVLSLRPLTVGELLDAAAVLLRENAAAVLPVAAALALAEQAALAPLREAAGVRPPGYAPNIDRLGASWLLLAAGAATEVMIIAGVGCRGCRRCSPAGRAPST